MSSQIHTPIDLSQNPKVDGPQSRSGGLREDRNVLQLSGNEQWEKYYKYDFYVRTALNTGHSRALLTVYVL
jgi:hypothetical protein